MATLGHKRTGVWGPGNIGIIGLSVVLRKRVVVDRCKNKHGRVLQRTLPKWNRKYVINLRRCTTCLWAKVFVVSETTL